MKLLQGYVWHPKDAPYTLADFLPARLGEAHVLFDAVTPPFAFFENGQLTSTQTFYQFTALRLYEIKPDHAEQHAHAEAVSAALAPLLDQTPPDLGWQLWEDLREL